MAVVGWCGGINNIIVVVVEFKQYNCGGGGIKQYNCGGGGGGLKQYNCGGGGV